MIQRLLDILRANTETKSSIDPALAAAALMFEIVWADHYVDEPELQSMSRSLAKLFDLDPTTIDRIIAQTRELHEQSVGVYQYTKELNDQLDPQQKVEVVSALWRIAYADQEINRFEEHMIRRIAELLYVPHSQFIKAKQLARESS